MASIHQVMAAIDAPARDECPAQRPSGSVPDEVLRFAPKRIRLRAMPEDRVGQLEDELKEWQERAARAETRLKTIEASIQQIAARYVRAPADGHSTPARAGAHSSEE